MLYDNTFGFCFRARRLLGETQAEFAKRMGVTVSTVSRWEAGKLVPAGAHMRQLLTIARRLRAASSIEVIANAPGIEALTMRHNTYQYVVVSEGFKAALRIPLDELATAKKSDHQQAIFDELHNHPAWADCTVAYYKTHHYSDFFGGWIKTLGALTYDLEHVVWRAAPAAPRRDYSLEIVTLDDWRPSAQRIPGDILL